MSMNDADRRLSAWLESVAPAREPEHLLDTVLAQTARTSRRPAWRIPERWIPMTTITTPVTSGGSARWPFAVPRRCSCSPSWRAPSSSPARASRTLPGAVRRRRRTAPSSTSATATSSPSTSPPAASTVILDAAGRAGRARVLARRHVARLLRGASTRPSRSPVEFELRVAGCRRLRTPGRSGRSIGPTGVRLVAVGRPDRGGGRSSTVGPAITIVDVASGSSTVLDLGIPAEQPAFRPGRREPARVPRPRRRRHVGSVPRPAPTARGPTDLDLDPGFQEDVNYGDQHRLLLLRPGLVARRHAGSRSTRSRRAPSTGPRLPRPRRRRRRRGRA